VEKLRSNQPDSKLSALKSSVQKTLLNTSVNATEQTQELAT